MDALNVCGRTRTAGRTSVVHLDVRLWEFGFVVFLWFDFSMVNWAVEADQLGCDL